MLEDYRKLVIRILDACSVAARVDTVVGARTTVVEVRAIGPEAKAELFGPFGAALTTITNLFGKKAGRRYLLVILDENGNKR